MYDSARDCFTEQQQQERREQQDRERQQQEQASPAVPVDAGTPPRRRISTVGDLLGPVEGKSDALKGSAGTKTSSDKREGGSPEASSETMSPQTPLKDIKNTSLPKTSTDTTSTTATTTTAHSEAKMDSNAPASSSATKRRRVSSSSPGERRQRVSNERDGDASNPATSRTDNRRPTSDDPRGARGNFYAPRRRSRSPAHHQPYQRRPTSPGGRYRYKSPPPPLIPKRDPSPTLPPGEDGSRSRDSSPPRKRKRPGQASRFSEREKAENRERIRKMEEEIERKAKEVIKERGVEEVVKAHYNDKRELGKTWRKTDSRIKGLRSFNNWIKSTIVQKFSPNDDFDPRNHSRDSSSHLVVLDMGCGKGGDLLKWKSAPQEVRFYVGVDTADVSIQHARDRYESMIRDSRRRRSGGRGGGGHQIFQAEFHVMDCWTRWVGEIPIVSKVGVDPNVGPGQPTRMSARWGSGGG